MSRSRAMPGADQTPLERGPNGHYLCRWCGRETTGNRQRTFCPKAERDCVEQWKLRTSPSAQRRLVLDRDKGVCASCALDCKALARRIERICEIIRERFYGYPYAAGGRERAIRHVKRLNRALRSLDLKRAAPEAGQYIPYAPHTWEMDHIVPVVEGGGVDRDSNPLDNLRTLCLPCHHRETADLARRRAEKRKAVA